MTGDSDEGGARRSYRKRRLRTRCGAGAPHRAFSGNGLHDFWSDRAMRRIISLEYCSTGKTNTKWDFKLSSFKLRRELNRLDASAATSHRKRSRCRVEVPREAGSLARARFADLHLHGLRQRDVCECVLKLEA